MLETIKISLVPHPDIELDRDRAEIDAFITLPDQGIGPDTGVIMVVPTMGEYADSDFHSQQLRPYLADKLDCIAVGVNYFGIYRNSQIQIRPSFLSNINRIYGLSLSMESFADAQSAVDVYKKIAEPVLALGVTSLDLRCQPHLITGKDEYQSWGFLPAIDCLQVLGEVLQRYDLNQRKVLACGRNYGAYIADLMGKFAPHTFAAIVDLAGHTRTELKHVVSGELMEADYMFNFNLNNDLLFYIASTCNNPWTIEDELSPLYFSDSHRKIRSLWCEAHRIPSETHYYVLQPAESSSRADRDLYADLLQQYNPVDYRRLSPVEYEKITNELELFNFLDENMVCKWEKQQAGTDFSLNSRHVFSCGDRSYQFAYDETGKLEVSII